jgi:lysine biosynthesis protein LysW
MRRNGNNRNIPSISRGSGKKMRWEIPKTRCPNCDTAIKVEKLCEGAVIVCPGSSVELEIVSRDPFEVDFTADWQNECEGE